MALAPFTDRHQHDATVPRPSDATNCRQIEELRVSEDRLDGENDDGITLANRADGATGANHGEAVQRLACRVLHVAPPSTWRTGGRMVKERSPKQMRHRKPITPLSRRCYHEAGHAVACVVLRGQNAVQSVHVLDLPAEYVKRSHAAGRRIDRFNAATVQRPPGRREAHDCKTPVNAAVIAVAGWRASHRAAPYRRRDDAIDHEGGDDVAALSVAMNALRPDDFQDGRAFRMWIERRADGLLAAFWPAVESVARALRERGRLTGSEVAAFVNARRDRLQR